MDQPVSDLLDPDDYHMIREQIMDDFPHQISHGTAYDVATKIMDRLLALHDLDAQLRGGLAYCPLVTDNSTSLGPIVCGSAVQIAGVLGVCRKGHCLTRCFCGEVRCRGWKADPDRPRYQVSLDDNAHADS